MIRDVWFSKPRIFKGSTGVWCCETIRADEWCVVGLGHSPLEAFADAKRIIVAAYQRIAKSVEFV